MESIYLRVSDDFDARQIYRRLQFYSRDAHNSNEVSVGERKADNIRHQWREEKLEFLELRTEVKLTYYSSPNEIPEKDLAIHTLEIEISGEEQARKDTMKKLEMIIGIKIV